MPDPSTPLVALRPFIPARDFAASKRFYLDLGFTVTYDGPDIAVLENGPHSFLLQNYYDAGWANNCMMQMVVSDLDGWWQRMMELELSEKHDTPTPAAPKMQSWGMRVGFLHDPAGVLWHIAEQQQQP